LKLKCTKFDFGWCSAPDPSAGAYSVPQTPSLDLRGLLLKGRNGEERKGKERGGIRGKRKGENGDCPLTIFGLKVALTIYTQLALYNIYITYILLYRVMSLT